MQHSVDGDLGRFDLKKDSMITDAHAVLGSKICESLHITHQVVLKGFDFPDDPLSN